VDLVDLDIQGVESEVLAPSFDVLTAKVGIVHVGTHSASIDRELWIAFKRHGWLNAFAYPSNSQTSTRFGRVTFVDGVQTWVNPVRGDLLDVLADRPRQPRSPWARLSSFITDVRHRR
jgi:hypothetical protein